MKTYRRLVLIIAGILGFIALLLMASFTTFNDCAFANQRTVFIKNQMRLALNAPDFAKAKYYAFRAIKGINKTKLNYKNCGCKPALIKISEAEQNLKEATKATSFEESKTFLQIALNSTLTSIDALKEFEDDNNYYGHDALVQNTNQVIDEQGGILLPRSKKLKETMDNSLMEFEESLENIVLHVACADAFSFISKIHNKTKVKLSDSSLSAAKKYYHGAVKEITYNALTSLEDCPVK